MPDPTIPTEVIDAVNHADILEAKATNILHVMPGDVTSLSGHSLHSIACSLAALTTLVVAVARAVVEGKLPPNA